jgi:methylated-DNA-[protein]-cysteine S-methyltransferase
MFFTITDSPIGELLLAGDGVALRRVDMREGRRPVAISSSWERNDAVFADVRRQLDEYFDGRRRVFDLPLSLAGNPFERRVWEALREIPYGQTISYGALAAAVGNPGGARAVGVANARNPVAVIVPCHRVIGADGNLTGYGGGLERKRFLLDLEAGTTALPMAG